MNLIAALEDLLIGSTLKCGTTHIIAIDGRAGAGKTTLAHELFLAFSVTRNVRVIHLDEVYAGWEHALGETLTKTLTELLESLAEDQRYSLPIYNWNTMAFDSEREIAPCNLIIIEGVGSAQSAVRKRASATIWLDIDPAIGLQRVLQRDGAEISEQMKKWQLDEAELFQSDQTQEKADFILSTM